MPASVRLATRASAAAASLNGSWPAQQHRGQRHHDRQRQHSAAGSINGSIGVNFVSAGAVDGVSNGLGTLGVGSIDYGVSGTIQAKVINTANPVINTPRSRSATSGSVTRRRRQFVSVTNQAGTPPQAALNASISGNAPMTASGAFNLLTPGCHQQLEPAGRHEHRHAGATTALRRSRSSRTPATSATARRTVS